MYYPTPIGYVYNDRFTCFFDDHMGVANFQKAEIHVSISSGFTPGAGTLYATITDPAIGHCEVLSRQPTTVYYIKKKVYTTTGSTTGSQLFAITTKDATEGSVVQDGINNFQWATTSWFKGKITCPFKSLGLVAQSWGGIPYFKPEVRQSNQIGGAGLFDSKLGNPFSSSGHARIRAVIDGTDTEISWLKSKALNADGTSWEDAVAAEPLNSQEYGIPAYGRPIELSDGSALFPIYFKDGARTPNGDINEPYKYGAGVARTTDGETFTLWAYIEGLVVDPSPGVIPGDHLMIDPDEPGGKTEHEIIKISGTYPNEHLISILRPRSVCFSSFWSESFTSGQTWSTPVQTNIQWGHDCPAALHYDAVRGSLFVGVGYRDNQNYPPPYPNIDKQGYWLYRNDTLTPTGFSAGLQVNQSYINQRTGGNGYGSIVPVTIGGRDKIMTVCQTTFDAVKVYTVFKVVDIETFTADVLPKYTHETDPYRLPTFTTPTLARIANTIHVVGDMGNLLDEDTKGFFARDINGAEWFSLNDTLTRSGDTYTATEAITFSTPDKIVARAGVLRGTTWYYSEESAALTVRDAQVPVNSGAISDSAIFGIQGFGGFSFGQLDGYPADYEFAPIATDELVVYAFNGAPVAVLDAATDVCVTRELFGLEELMFSLSPTDAKYSEIRHLRRVALDGRSYIIDRTGDERNENLSGKVVAVSLATHELGKIKNYGLKIETLTAAGGAAMILLGTTWKLRTVSDTTKKRSYTPGAGETVLSNLLAWVDIFNLYPVFDSQTREIDLVANPGASNGVEIRVGKNARGIKREIDSGNLITRLYVYGKDDLSIAEANPTGLPYIDNFSYFIETEGVTEQEIYADIVTNGKDSRYLAEGEWRDNRYTDVTSLFMDALVKLEEACRPKARYGAKVIDLARLVGSGYEHEAFALGDTLRLVDEELGIDTLQYVVREKRYPFEPERDEVELANKRLSVVDALTRAARVIEMVDRRGGAWEDSADRVAANFDAWMRAHSLNEDGTIPIDLLRGIWYAANSAIRAGLNESVIIDNNGLTIAEHTVVEDYNVNGSFGSIGFSEIAFGGYSGTVQLNWKTDRFIRMTGGSIVMCAGEGLPIRTAITPDGILAPALIIDNDNPLTPDGNAVVIDERGISVFHNNDPENQGYIRIGGGVIESWNFSDANKTGFQIIAATGAIIAHSLVLDGYIEVGDVIDTSDNTVSSDGTTTMGGSKILINSSGLFAFKNGAYKMSLDIINDVYRFSGELFAGSIETLTNCNIGTDAYLGKNSGNLRSLWINSAHGVRIHNSGSGANLSLAGMGTFTVAVDDFINLRGYNYFNANIGSDYGGITFGWQGVIDISFSDVFAAQASISFGTSFVTTPFVLATAYGPGSSWNSISIARFNVGVHSVTASGCTVAAREVTDTSQTGTLKVTVSATQCKPI